MIVHFSFQFSATETENWACLLRTRTHSNVRMTFAVDRCEFSKFFVIWFWKLSHFPALKFNICHWFWVCCVHKICIHTHKAPYTIYCKASGRSYFYLIPVFAYDSHLSFVTVVLINIFININTFSCRARLFVCKISFFLHPSVALLGSTCTGSD